MDITSLQGVDTEVGRSVGRMNSRKPAVILRATGFVFVVKDVLVSEAADQQIMQLV